MPLNETLRPARRIVIISDFCAGQEPIGHAMSIGDHRAAWLSGQRGSPPLAVVDGLAPMAQPPVLGGYLERLPLAAIRAGLCDTAEIWTFRAHDFPVPDLVDSSGLVRRSFRTDPFQCPFSSDDMLGHIAAFGPPDILCVWGLGVDETILRACAASVKIYNSIDAPALRVPPNVSRHFDLVLTGAEWQSDEVKARHPDMATAIMPIGPEFASPDTFFPLVVEKTYDVIYVAAAQPYKRHKVLFNALSKLPRSTKALCVCGYGELGDTLRANVSQLGIAVDFVGPPGVGFNEVNRLMNSARIGVVCGIDDGAPAILTEYMLAGLPVLANAGLRCGLQFIKPSTGRSASEDEFHSAIAEMLETLDRFTPRETVMQNWTWWHSAGRLALLVEDVLKKKSGQLRHASLTQR